MDFVVLILTIGIPGSGKTTWVKKFCKRFPTTYVVSTDDIRKEITGVEECIDPSQNTMIHDEAKKRVKKIIDDRKNIFSKDGTWPVIIVDSTNVELKEWIDYKKLGASVMLAKLFDIKPEEAIKRNQNRDRKVPTDIIQMKYDLFLNNQKYIPKIFNMIINFL